MQPSPTAEAALPLTENERAAALSFLRERPIQTVIMASWLNDHRFANEQGCGTFYQARDSAGQIAGVALIGRNTTFEARSDEAIRAFAYAARTHKNIKMVFGETGQLSEFWRHYAPSGLRHRSETTQLLFEVHERPEREEPGFDLRPAEMKELGEVTKAHAAMVFDETGTDPLTSDAEGFHSRCAGRIDQGRVWVHMAAGRLLFKADVVSDTPQAKYLEGLWVDPEFRGLGVARRCLSNLCRRLLNGSNAVCAFVESKNTRAQSLYFKNGFLLVDLYRKFYI